MDAIDPGVPGRRDEEREMSSTSETITKTWDGHALNLTLAGAGYGVTGEWLCPHDGKTFEGEETPLCRRAYDPEVDEEPGWKPHDRCVPGEYWDDARFDVFDGQPEFVITRVPVPVQFWFEGYESDEFHVEPVRVDADGTYEVRQPVGATP